MRKISFFLTERACSMELVQRNALGVLGTLGIVCFLASSVSLPHAIIMTIESNTTMNHGILNGKYSLTAPYHLVWESVDVTTKRLNEVLQEAAPLLAQTYVAMELDFVRKHPEAVKTEMFLKPYETLCKDGIEHVDWKDLEAALYAQLVQFFCNTDFAQYLAPGERQWFVTAKEVTTGKTVGVIQLIVLPEYEPGTVKVAMFGVDTDACGKEIEKLLLSSIFRVIPELSRIFLHTRKTNGAMITALEVLGFTPFKGPLPYWQDMEYLCKNTDQLQKVAQGFQQ